MTRAVGTVVLVMVSWVNVTHLHNVVVKQQPEAVALHDGDVVASVWAAGERVVCQTSGDPSAHAH